MLPKRSKKLEPDLKVLNMLLDDLLLPLKWIKIMNLSSLIRFHRKAADLSQIELAALANVSRKVVQCIESGGEQVSWKNVRAVLAVLNVALTPTGPLVSQWQEGVEQTDQEP
jgi:HTH-type transcriptional regulator/antitoxin HipB